MKLICEGLDLCDAVLKVLRAAAVRTPNPVLEGIKLTAREDTVTLCATDQELAIEKTIVADVKIAGEVVVPGKFFAEFVKKLSNEQIELSLTNENTLKIKGKITITIINFMFLFLENIFKTKSPISIHKSFNNIFNTTISNLFTIITNSQRINCEKYIFIFNLWYSFPFLSIVSK